MAAGKVLLLAEMMGKWVLAVKDYTISRLRHLSQFEELTGLRESYAIESEKANGKWKVLEKDEQSIDSLREDLEKMEIERNQINQDKIACKDKLEKGKKLSEELNGESGSWKSELAAIGDELENLLGNVLILAATICILPPFGNAERCLLKQFMLDSLSENEIPFNSLTSSDEELDKSSIGFSLIDRTTLEQWRLAGLPNDTFYTENAVAINHSTKWPLILDINGRALNWLRVLFKDRQVKIVQNWSHNKDANELDTMMSTVQNCASNGDILILYDDACSYDSRLNTLYERAVCLKDPDQEPNDHHEKEMMVIGGEEVVYSPHFRLYFISRRALQPELQTRCCVVNFTFTPMSLHEFFLDTVFEREKPAKRQEYLLVCGREIEALSSSKKHREKIQVI